MTMGEVRTVENGSSLILYDSDRPVESRIEGTSVDLERVA
jgi:hypothetical protein